MDNGNTLQTTRAIAITKTIAIPFILCALLSLVNISYLVANIDVALAASGNTIKDVNFGSPFNNTFNLGIPSLVEYDNTTSLKGVGINNAQSITATFAGFGTV